MNTKLQGMQETFSEKENQNIKSYNMGQNVVKSDFNKQNVSMKCNFIKKGLKYYTCKWREV